jgi:hypothetical protein
MKVVAALSLSATRERLVFNLSNKLPRSTATSQTSRALGESVARCSVVQFWQRGATGCVNVTGKRELVSIADTKIPHS